MSNTKVKINSPGVLRPNTNARTQKAAVMRTFILVASDTHASLVNKPGALQVANLCLEKSIWGLGQRLIAGPPIGSPVLIYLAGKRECSQTFIAQCVIAGDPINKKPKIDEKVWDRIIPLKSIRRFKKPIEIRPLLKCMGISTIRWGARFQGGVISIKLDTFHEIVRVA
jgi:hypothetical protein